MKTSKQWWDEVNASEMKTKAWLRKQWRGEVTASFRIKKLAAQYTGLDSKEAKILQTIAQQEDTHATWIKQLLDSRQVEVDSSDIEQAETRYWAETLPGITDLTTGSAIAAHAEGMRLERIRVIVDDTTAPEDIRNVFKLILKDEIWHEKAFRELSTSEALQNTQHNHRSGREALGLVP